MSSIALWQQQQRCVLLSQASSSCADSVGVAYCPRPDVAMVAALPHSSSLLHVGSLGVTWADLHGQMALGFCRYRSTKLRTGAPAEEPLPQGTRRVVE